MVFKGLESGLWLGLCLSLLCDAASAGSRPNIIVFMVDDYDKRETSVYGGNVLTPNLDRLAREGMTFHNAHVTSTVCTPSRYTFLTGRYAGASTFPVYMDLYPSGQQGFPGFNVGLENDNMNVGAVLARHGYATGFVGKYHVGFNYDKGEGSGDGVHPMRKSAPYTEEVFALTKANQERYQELIRKRGFTWARHIYWDTFNRPINAFNPEWTIQAALEFIDIHQDQPFYLHYATNLLHGGNKRWFRSLKEDELMGGSGPLEKPLNIMPSRESVLQRIETAGLGRDDVGYLWMDDSLGALLDKLDDLGIADNTIVVFVADHGSDKKGTLFKAGGTEIPCLIRWPKGIKPGMETDELVQNTDFVPTWFELAGVKPPDGYRIDGVSLVPLFSDPQHSVRDFVYGEIGAARSIKTRDWNYISLRYPADLIARLQSGDREAMNFLLGLSGGVSRRVNRSPYALDLDQLYHLEEDPQEQQNLVGDPKYRLDLARLKGLLAQVLKRFPNRPYGEFVTGGNAVSRDASLGAKEVLQRGVQP